MIEAFPLCWPDGWPRRMTGRRNSPYKVSAEIALQELLGDLRLMGGRNIIVSSNVGLRRDGTFYRDQAADTIPDPGVAVYWDDKQGDPMVIACDIWRTVRENTRSVGLTVGALRMIDRAGASHLLQRAFTGFKRLPAPDDKPKWWDVLGVDPDLPKDAVVARYRELARQQHPDRGGDPATMARINQAYHEAVAS